MQVGKDYYFINFFYVCCAFFLFTIIISIFGFFFYYYLQKINKKNWELNTPEKFLISFALGIAVYISICFILDIFEFFNFFSAYLSFVIFDIIFITYLYSQKKKNNEDLHEFKSYVKKQLVQNSKEILTFVAILSFAIIIQVWIQWEIVTKEYAIPSKDTYRSLGQSWYLLEEGKMWREPMTIQYPRGYIFYLAAPELIYPDFRFAYFYIKFGGIPLFSFYIFAMAIILKRLFEKNYMIFIGLSFVLSSVYLFSRFTFFASSTICAFLILISLIIFYSKCPFYLTGFILISLIFFNTLIAIFYGLLLICVLVEEFFRLNKLKQFLTEIIIKIIMVISILIIPYIIHSFVVQKFTINDYFVLFDEIFSFLPLNFSYTLNNEISNFPLLQLRYLIKDLFPHNDFVYAFLDIEKRLLSYFFIFALISIFLPIKGFFGKKHEKLIIIAKSSIIIILGFYMIEIFFLDYPNVFFRNSDWFKLRAVEAFTGPIVIIVCFVIRKVIVKATILTNYLTNRFVGYRRLINTQFFSRLLRIENILIATILISSLSALNINRSRIYISYYFEKGQIDTIFYIKENVPDNSRILVHFYDGTGDALHSLLSTYKTYDWEFEKNENNFTEILRYIDEKGIEYILLDLDQLNSTEISYFKNYTRFEKLYENDYHLLYEYDN